MRKKFSVYRCLFCKHEVGERVEYCPYCGASKVYLVNPAEFFNYRVNIDNLSDMEVSDLIKTLELEIDNADFYRKAEEFSDSLEYETYYRYLRRHEEYHVDEIAKIIGVSNIDAVDTEGLELPDNHRDIFIKSTEIEERAIDFYNTAKERAGNKTLEYIYEALIEAEEYHVDIFEFLKYKSEEVE